jgi:hypothetical protein
MAATQPAGPAPLTTASNAVIATMNRLLPACAAARSRGSARGATPPSQHVTTL